MNKTQIDSTHLRDNSCWISRIFNFLIDERAVLGTIFAILCFIYVGFMAFISMKAAWGNEALKDPLTGRMPEFLAFSLSAAASFVIVWLFQGIEGKLKIKIWLLEIEGPSCAMLLWCAGFLSMLVFFHEYK